MPQPRVTPEQTTALDEVKATPFKGRPRIRFAAGITTVAREAGLDRGHFEDEIELALRRNRIEVVPFNYEGRNAGLLWVIVSTLKVGIMIVTSVEAEYSERVIALRQTEMKVGDGMITATLWRTSHSAVSLKEGIPGAAKDLSEKVTNEFCLDYLRANPGEQK